MNDSEQQLLDLITEALDEAKMLEFGRATFDDQNMLNVAHKMYGIPKRLLEQVYYNKECMFDKF